jgi:hypothetical protein
MSRDFLHLLVNAISKALLLVNAASEGMSVFSERLSFGRQGPAPTLEIRNLPDICREIRDCPCDQRKDWTVDRDWRGCRRIDWFRDISGQVDIEIDRSDIYHPLFNGPLFLCLGF